ncbi:hypothetical protein L207DRAFT_517106 [Hyaloscypha variabilis F]|uniref:G domain-containing protein n=1 Tax=Hyaloscypha variabilis (strain UAMH 11265 / GT02V1 / F) TaxID=1149755 RepID=A0A2J6R928_HYAVF|nr:hypothetical protein L207DRAFT_517106 [Hyaloscypha variabilis F]
MVSRKVDLNWDQFVERMSAGLPVPTLAPIPQAASVIGIGSGELAASKNPFSPTPSSSKVGFASPSPLAGGKQQLRVVEDDGLQVVPSGSTARVRVHSQHLVPRPLALPLRLATGAGMAGGKEHLGVGEGKGKARNPFTRPSPDSEGLQVVSPLTPASRGWNPYPTPISLQTPLNPWASGTSPALQSSNNPFASPRYADAEGLQAVVSNLGTGTGNRELEVRGDAYAVSSQINWGRNPLPYPVTPEMRNSQPALRWGAPWAQVLQAAFPNDSQAYLGNYPVQPPSEPPVVGGSSSSSSTNDEILIAVFGMTGTGKTTFIEKVSGQKLNIGHNLHSCTTNIEKIHCKIGTHKITLVDTPGFDDTSRSDTDVLILIANWLRDSYKDRTLLSGIIYLHRISDPRMSGSSIKNLRMFRKLCGAESMHNVSLVTTMWDKVTRVEGEMRERDLMDGENGFWKAMIGGGCLVRRHDGSVDSAKGLVAELAGMERTVLRLQEEIAEGKRLIETEAGVSLNEELSRVRRQHEEELQCVKEEMAAAMKSGNEALQKKLEAHHAQVIADIEDRASQQAALLNTKAWDLEDQIHAEKTKNREEQASLEMRVQCLGEEQMRNFHSQEELRNQVRGLRRALTHTQGLRMGNEAYYRRWVCTRRYCGRAFYAPREQEQIWCFYCGKAFKT